jgi:hypothetical protein
MPYARRVGVSICGRGAGGAPAIRQDRLANRLSVALIAQARPVAPIGASR